MGLTLSGLIAASGVTRAAEPAEKVLPANTFFLVKIENMAGLREGFTASQMGQLLADPGMKPFLDKLTSVLEQPNEQLKQAVGLTIPELLTLPQGQVFVSLIGQPGEKIPLALFVSADAGDNAAKMAEVMATVDKLAEQSGASVATDQVDSLTLHVIRNKDDESTPPLVSGADRARSSRSPPAPK